jgi:hypothetical protein
VARINASAMQPEMPRHYWRNLPEAAEIDMLMRQGGECFAANHKEGDHDNFSADLAHAGGAKIFATYHPSAILRADGGRRDELRAYLIAALQQAATFAAR